MALAEQVHREVHQLPPHLSLRELEAAVERFPTLFKYRTHTLGEVLDECLADERLKALVAAWWPYFGLPPSKLSFFTITTPQTTLVHEGPFHCEGGTQTPRRRARLRGAAGGRRAGGRQRRASGS